MSARADNRAFPRILLVLAMAASMVATAVGSAAASDQFDDVPDENPFHDEIGWLVDQGITNGFGDGTFRPRLAVTRQAYLAFLYRMAGEPTWAGCDDGRFSDVDDTHLFCEEITWGAAMGITDGFGDGTFRPRRVVTRQAAAAFQFRSVGSPDHDHTAEFSDVDDEHPFHDEIAWMDGEGIAEGYGDGTYGPRRDVTRQAAAAFLFRMDEAGFTVDPGAAPGTPDFPATPTSSAHLPEDGARDYTVDTVDAETVTIELAVCANVAVTGEAASFEVDDSGTDDVAAFGETSATVSDVEVDGVAHTDAGAGESIPVDGGELTFTLDGADTAECVRPVVFEDLDGDGLDVEDDGRPTEDFGIGGETTFSDVVAVRLAPSAGGFSPMGTAHTVTATLLGQDLDGDEEPDVLPLGDQQFDVRVVRYASGDNRDLDCGNDLLGGTTVEEATVATDDDGRATLEYEGPTDPEPDTDGDQAYDCIVAEWEGTGDYQGQGPHEALAAKDWHDSAGGPTNLDLAPAQATAPVDTNHTVTATVTNRFGDPMEDVVVRFDIERDGEPEHTAERTTGADGEAALTYNGPSDEAEDTVTATALDDAGEDTVASDTATVTWSSSG